MAGNLSLYMLPFAAWMLLSSANAVADPCVLKNLHWLAGTWRDSDKDSSVEERWALVPGDRLMGSSWALHKNTPNGVIEAMTLLEEDGRPVMRMRHFDSTLARAREEKEAPMLFVATSCTRNSMTLDGTGGQSGERIIYTRDKKELKITGDFMHDGKPLHVELKFALAAEM